MEFQWLPAQHAEKLWLQIVGVLERRGREICSKSAVNKYMTWLECVYHEEIFQLMGLIYALTDVGQGISPNHLVLLSNKYLDSTKANEDFTTLFCWLKKKNQSFVEGNHKRTVVCIYYAMMVSNNIGGGRGIS
ncbi:MAG: hypothetical protein GY793_10810 [Proteobacteria bacterium]|nr:hypothetical protein [Pseudomonadota bacterium]